MKPSVHLVSLGCAKNLVDSEVMLGTLIQGGHTIEPNPAQADVIIVNTCGFVEDARRESIDAILQASKLRSGHPDQKILVAGCMAQRYVQDLQKELPEVSAFIGINEVPQIDRIVTDLANGHAIPSPSPAEKPSTPENLVTRKPQYLYDFATPRYQLTPSHFAYLKIAEGCNHPCAFCSIPIMRGRHRSRTIDDVEAEARALVTRGVRELLLISQDTTWYARDLGIEHGLSQLLRRLQAIEGDFWIRILYTHPAHWSEELIQTIAECPKVCRYIDMPLQHIDETMLIRMRRETSRAHIEKILHRTRAIIPEITIRTTFIVGFPGETESQFETLLKFVQDFRFDRLGVFAYSQEESTVAGRMEQQLPTRVKKSRRQAIMKAQQKISTAITDQKVGQTLKILVERSGEKLQGRTEGDAPEIDGKVALRGRGWKAGNFQTAEIIGSTAYDLIARVAKD